MQGFVIFSLTIIVINSVNMVPDLQVSRLNKHIASLENILQLAKPISSLEKTG